MAHKNKEDNKKERNNNEDESEQIEKKQNQEKRNQSYRNVIKGPLRLKKGGLSKITKPSKMSSHLNPEETNINLDPSEIEHIEKTEAQKKYEEKTLDKKKQLIKEKAQKSYREKINEFNEKVSKLSEYNDMPKI